MKSWLSAAALALVLVATPVAAQTRDDVVAALQANFGNPEIFDEAFAVIQAAIAEDDVASLAEYIPFGTPLNVNGEEVVLADEAELAARYDELITPEIKDVVAAQTFETLFVNADGVMLGNGEVWLNGICIDDACTDFTVKIVTLQNAM